MTAGPPLDTPETVDPGVSARHSRGAGFAPSTRDPALVAGLKARKVTLPPHPEWELPDVLDWSVDPFGQRNWRAQLHMLRWADVLRRAAQGGDQEAGDLWWHYVAQWLSTDHGAYRRVAWMDMIDGVRAKALVLGYPIVPESERQAYIETIREHATWLASPKNRGHSNHALHQLAGLFLCAKFLRDEGLAGQAVTQLAELIVEQYDDEGINAEGAVGYHLTNYRWWRGVEAMLEAEGATLAGRTNVLERAPLGLVHATRPDGRMETIGDTDVAPRDKNTPEMLYMATKGAEGTPPSTNFALYKAGYVFGRSGWGEFEQAFADETFYSLMFGKGIKVHGHDEAGALTFYTRGRPWLVDPGKYAYIKNDMRDHLISRAAHNVTVVLGRERKKDATVSLVRSSTGEDIDEIVLSDDGYDGIELTRRVAFHRAGEFLVVVDVVRADGEVTARQQWQVAEATTVSEAKNGYLLTSGDQSVRMQWTGLLPELSSEAGSKDPWRGWVSPGWMKTAKAHQIWAEKTGKNFRFVTVIGPTRHGVLEIERAQSLSGGIALAVRVGNDLHTISLMARRVATTFEQPTTAPRTSPVDALAKLAEAGEPWESLTDPALIAQGRGEAGADAAHRLNLAAQMARRVKRGGRHRDALRSAIVDVLGFELLKDKGWDALAIAPRRNPALAVGGRPALDARARVEIQAHDVGLGRLRSQPQDVTFATTAAGDLLLPWAARGGDGDTLLVKLHGAIQRQRMQLPAFMELTASKRGQRPFLLVQDPTLDADLDLRLGWYLGSTDQDGHVALASLIEQVRQALGLEHVLVMGSSGGGFAALQVAGVLPDSVALAMNPQTFLPHYHRSSANLAAKAVCGKHDVEALPPELLDVAERWRRAEHTVRARIISNVGDVMHDNRHVRHLETQMAALDGIDLRVDRTDWGPGHIAASPEARAEYTETTRDMFFRKESK